MKAPQERPLRLRCMAYPDTIDGKQGYFAMCIDLDLVTWRPTFKDAKNSLHQAVLGYIETVNSSSDDPQEIRRLFHRPAPLWPYHFQYHAILLLKKITRRELPRRKAFDQSVPCARFAVA